MKTKVLKNAAAVCLAASLSGCFTMHQNKTYPTLAFSAPLSYQEVYRRMDAAARVCMQNARRQGAIYTDNQTADYHFVAGIANENPMNVLVKSTGPSSSEVTITYVNFMGWNENLANALRESILTGKTAC